jgi:uncharacterized protein (DUF1810 family)
MSDPHNLQRFVNAQDPVYAQVLAELRDGFKRSHWMWFVFPQIEGLGQSAMAKRFAITSRDEAIAYLNHPVLGQRLKECTGLINAVEGRSIEQIFGRPDNLKFQSSITLFAQVTLDNNSFIRAIQKYFAGQFDRATLDRL